VVADPGLDHPQPDNRKVPVILEGDMGLHLTALPNPANNETRYPGAPPGTFSAGYAPNARLLVQTAGYGGIVTTLTFTKPPEGTTVRLSRVIYDITGNVVAKASADLLQSAIDGGLDVSNTTLSIDVYWNCFNGAGMPVAPGIYREIMMLDYSASNMKDPPPQHINYGVLR